MSHFGALPPCPQLDVSHPPCVVCVKVSLTRSPPHWEGSDRRFLLSSDRTLVVKELSSEDVADVHGLLSHYHQVRRGEGGEAVK